MVIRGTRARLRVLVGVVGLGVALVGTALAETPADGPWALPEADSCAPKGGLAIPGGTREDTALPFQPGDVFEMDRIEVLRDYLPAFIWEHRDRFFFDGMRLEIGPCFRDYGAPAFYHEATKANAGQPRLDENGGLVDYQGGAPFDPATLSAEDPELGRKWLWNIQHRYQAAGFRGPFRMTDLVGRVGRAEPFEGDMFKAILSHRADLADSGYAWKDAKGNHWVAGGLFTKPFDAREYAWRQFRNLENEVSADRSDDLHAYLPQWRRVRRLNANRVEGLYMPSFSVGVVPNQQLAAGTANAAGGVAGVGGGAGVGGTIANQRSGYEGLEFRPILHEVQIVGLHDVLAPINIGKPVYPEGEDRDFGPWGLSFGDDRWDLRRTLVLRTKMLENLGGNDMAAMRLYVDLQTLQPLYVGTEDLKGELTNVGLYAGRWSEDREDYPAWPADETRAIRVIDSVGAGFANLAESGSWRRESWHNVSTPPPDSQLKRQLSVGQLTKRR